MFALEKPVWNLLIRFCNFWQLAGVLLDTENLDFASMRDTEMTTTLLVGSGSLGRNGFFDQRKATLINCSCASSDTC